MSDIVLGIRLTADGKELVGSANVSQEAMKKLRGEVDANADAARKLNEQQKNLGSAMTSAREALARHAAELGGNETASRALYTTAMRLGPVFGVVALAVAGLTTAYMQGAKEAREQAAAIQLTGNYAGTTAGQMRALAQSMSESGWITIDTSKEIVTQLVGSGRIGAEALAAVGKLAEDYAKATGRQVKEIAPDLVKLFSDPAKGAEQLNQQFHQLSVAQLEHIAQLERIGEKGKAQLETAKALAPVMAKTREELGLLEGGWNSVQRAASSAWDAMLGIGRPKSIGDQLDEQSLGGRGRGKGRAAATADKEARDSEDNRRAQDLYDLWKKQAPEAGIAALKDRLKAIDNAPPGFDSSMAAQLRSATQKQLDALQNPKSGAAGAATGQDMEAYLRNLEKKVELTKQGSEADQIEADLEHNIWKNDTPERRAAIEQRRLELLYIGQKKLAFDAELQQKRDQAAVDDASKALAERAQTARQQALASARQAVDVGNDELRIAETEISLMGSSEAERRKAVETLKAELQARRDIKALRLEGEQADSLMADRIAAAQSKANAQNMTAAAAEQKRFWDGVSNDINRALTDSIMRGFEAGKGFAQSFGDSLKHYFETLVISIPIRFISNAVTGMLANAFPGAAGLFSGGNGGGGGAGGGGIGNMLSLGNSLSGLGSLFGGSSVGSLGAAGVMTAAPVFEGGAMLAGAEFASLASGAGASAFGGAAVGALGALGPIGLGIGALALMGGLGGKKKAPAVFGNYDAPSLTFGPGGLSGTVYGNSTAGARWAGEQFTGQWGDEAAGQYSQFESIGRRLGKDVSGLRGVSATFNGGAFTNHGDVLAPAIEALSHALGQSLVPNLDQLARSGETAAQTLTRLADEQDAAAAQQQKIAEQQQKLADQEKARAEAAAEQERQRAHQQRLADIDRLSGREMDIGRSLTSFGRDLPGRLGIPGLESAGNSLATSGYVAPLERAAAARRIASSTYGRAMGGDLGAVNAFPGDLQNALGIYRDVYASGPQFQGYFKEGNQQLQGLLGRQKDVQVELLQGIDTSILQMGADTVDAIRAQTRQLTEELAAVRAELRALRESS